MRRDDEQRPLVRLDGRPIDGDDIGGDDEGGFVADVICVGAVLIFTGYAFGVLFAWLLGLGR